MVLNLTVRELRVTSDSNKRIHRVAVNPRQTTVFFYLIRPSSGQALSASHCGLAIEPFPIQYAEYAYPFHSLPHHCLAQWRKHRRWHLVRHRGG